MKKLLIVTTLALGTATFTTGCDKLDTGMIALAAKASALESKLMDAVPKARAFVSGLEQHADRFAKSVIGGAAVLGPDGSLTVGGVALGDLEQLGTTALRHLETWLDAGPQAGPDAGDDESEIYR